MALTVLCYLANHTYTVHEEQLNSRLTCGRKLLRLHCSTHQSNVAGVFYLWPHSN